MKRKNRTIRTAGTAFLAGFVLFTASEAREKKPTTEEGEFRIFFAGREIGIEKFAILSAKDSASSTSILHFQNPGEERQKVKIESKLEMDMDFRPRSYRLETDVNGKRGNIVGVFAPNQVIFEYSGEREPIRSGLLLGDRCTILDTNLFHHYIFLVRLYLLGDAAKSGRFEVVVPQEKSAGKVEMKLLGKGTIQVGPQSYKSRHLQLSSGSVRIDLWVDDSGILRKIAVPEKSIEVLRTF